MELFMSQGSSTIISTNCSEKHTVLDGELANYVILSRFLNELVNKNNETLLKLL